MGSTPEECISQWFMCCKTAIALYPCSSVFPNEQGCFLERCASIKGKAQKRVQSN